MARRDPKLAAARARHDAIARHVANLLHAGEREPKRSEMAELEAASLELGHALAGRNDLVVAEAPSPPQPAAKVPAPAVDGDALARVLGMTAARGRDDGKRCGMLRGKYGLPCVLDIGHDAGQERPLHSSGRHTWRERRRKV